MSENTDLVVYQNISEYYSRKITEYGPVPQGVDWNGKCGQELRFKQLSKLITEYGVEIIDLGCGYGAFWEYISGRKRIKKYYGVDVSEKMIGVAKELYPSKKAEFIVAKAPHRKVDYCVCSGIFNVRLQHNDKLWKDHIYCTLRELNSSSSKGFAFNCLSSYSDQEKQKAYLYYCDPCSLFHFCKTEFSNQVALLHDYGLYEFTIIVRKD
ncbi:MAG: SAM-dependent methyltransferase [Kangiellaceae bacterium]|nr:SAM-dependent methyltransferase [Kangiellaceae bacterium]|tara:strand:- start:5496 stop:6125 length:630 start_codon:yes stop_codon:yes gene_type:complete